MVVLVAIFLEIYCMLQRVVPLLSEHAWKQWKNEMIDSSH
jgi:hypothetical protein